MTTSADRAAFAYPCDAFVLPGHRGRGLIQALMAAIHVRPHLQGLRRFGLVTSAAHGLYSTFGFATLRGAQSCMERHVPGVYCLQR
ncbi:GNAT family N-acetyltransferase [Xanthomonas axonopodis pv. poinsettiicola]|uniref:GNAT family N-acetyltransferase n=1 Tax=Xanthomonas TaxID=338 RepID=UPI002B4B9C74|nr:GNAT family N-acetyltransferase [Xanthomonas codiaei]